jgi:Tol biopolymer transport system component
MKLKVIIGIIIVIIVGVAGINILSNTKREASNTSGQDIENKDNNETIITEDPDKVTPLDSIFIPERGYLLGALPIPYDGQDLIETYRLASETCELVPVWGRPSPYWEKSVDLEGSWGDFYLEELIRGNEMAPLLHFSFIGENLTLSMPENTDYTLSDTKWRQEYKQAVLDSVRICRPIYLSLGNEVNRWYEKYGMEGANGFHHWISIYEEIYEEVKKLSPETIIFCTFSREIVMENKEADLSILSEFNSNKIDLLVFTSYPYCLPGVNNPEDIPINYYSKIADLLPGKPVGFSEISWTTLDFFGGEQGQADFIDRLSALTANINVEFIMWPWLCDLSESDETGLIRRDGSTKLGYDAWKCLASQHTCPPEEIPTGILVDRIPEEGDILFVSIRYVLNDLDCLDENYEIKQNFLSDTDCLKIIYNSESNVLASPRQLYSYDIETGRAFQLTNVNYDFSSSKPVNDTYIMAIGAGDDTDGDGLISTNDEINIYLIDLASKEIICLTEDLNLTSINNPDYSKVNGKIIFSAQRNGIFHNYLFTLDFNKNLVQLTSNESYHDFDCSWSEDGKKIVYSRLPDQEYPWIIPSQVWIMNSDGSNMIQITGGGPNPEFEDPHGPYPIGIDADPDLSPDNKRIVFSRLKTGKDNEPFGVFELIIHDIESGEETVLDSSYANMIPEWKSQGIVFIRQVGSSSSVMERKQSIYIYTDEFVELELDPFNIFPIGSNGASWIE